MNKIKLFLTNSIYPSKENIENLGSFETKEEVFEAKNKKIKELSFVSYYTRCTIFEKEKIITEDFGSWNKFFQIEFKTKKDLFEYLNKDTKKEEK